MKAITITQPWSSLIVQGIKNIENRTWYTKFRGRVLVHCSAKDSGSIYQLLNNEQIDVVNNHWTDYYPHRPCGAIIGSVEIIDCVINHSSVWAENIDPQFASLHDLKPIYNWVLANPIMFPQPITGVKGKLSFWEYEPITEELHKIIYGI